MQNIYFKMIKKLDADIAKHINLLVTKHKSIVAFLKLITHTSSGLVYLIYTYIP